MVKRSGASVVDAGVVGSTARLMLSPNNKLLMVVGCQAIFPWTTLLSCVPERTRDMVAPIRRKRCNKLHLEVVATEANIGL